MNFRVFTLLSLSLICLAANGGRVDPSDEGSSIQDESTNKSQPPLQPEPEINTNFDPLSGDLNGDGLVDEHDIQDSGDHISSDYVMGSSIDFHPEQLCDPDLIRYPGNLRGAYEIDVNIDSVIDLLLLLQYNNSASFHLFYQTDCGFEKVTDRRGGSITFLSYASSSSCQPIGCHELTFCIENDGQRTLVNVSGRHTLTPEETHKWWDGNLPDADVTSQITITKFRLVDGKLIEVDSQVVPNVLDNLELFKPNDLGVEDDGHSWGFDISSCA